MPVLNSRLNGEGWWTDARKLLLTQILALLLTPASVVVTLLVTDSYKAPQPSLEYVSAVPYYYNAEPPRSLVDQINRGATLAWQFRQALRGATAASAGPEDCISWLDGGDWDQKCEGIYKSVTSEMKGMASSALEQVKEASSLKSPLPMPGPEQLAETERSINVMDQLAKSLVELDTKDQSRSGEVEISVGVMNRGASDGLVFEGATVKFSGGEFHAYTEKYVPIGAHSFAEVAFNTAREENGKFYGKVDEGEEEVIKVWSDLIKQGKEVPFELVVTVSDKTVSIKTGSVPHETGS